MSVHARVRVHAGSTTLRLPSAKLRKEARVAHIVRFVRVFDYVWRVHWTSSLPREHACGDTRTHTRAQPTLVPCLAGASSGSWAHLSDLTEERQQNITGDYREPPEARRAHNEAARRSLAKGNP